MFRDAPAQHSTCIHFNWQPSPVLTHIYIAIKTCSRNKNTPAVPLCFVPIPCVLKSRGERGCSFASFLSSIDFETLMFILVCVFPFCVRVCIDFVSSVIFCACERGGRMGASLPPILLHAYRESVDTHYPCLHCHHH